MAVNQDPKPNVLDRARKLENPIRQFLLIFAVGVIVGGGLPLLLAPTKSPELREGGLLTLITGGFAIWSFLLTGLMFKIGLLQMEQAEEHRSTDAAVAEAMADLAKELRQLRKTPTAVNISLFGPENHATNTPVHDGEA